jgi:hypothetical protein
VGQIERAGGCRWIEKDTVVTIRDFDKGLFLFSRAEGKNLLLWTHAEAICNGAEALVSDKPRPPRRSST